MRFVPISIVAASLAFLGACTTQISSPELETQLTSNADPDVMAYIDAQKDPNRMNDLTSNRSEFFLAKDERWTEETLHWAVYDDNERLVIYGRGAPPVASTRAMGGAVQGAVVRTLIATDDAEIPVVVAAQPTANFESALAAAKSAPETEATASDLLARYVEITDASEGALDRTTAEQIAAAKGAQMGLDAFKQPGKFLRCHCWGEAEERPSDCRYRLYTSELPEGTEWTPQCNAGGEPRRTLEEWLAEVTE